MVQAYQKAGKEEDYKAAYEKAKELFPEALEKMEREAKEAESAQSDNAANTSQETETDTEDSTQ